MYYPFPRCRPAAAWPPGYYDTAAALAVPPPSAWPAAPAVPPPSWPAAAVPPVAAPTAAAAPDGAGPSQRVTAGDESVEIVFNDALLESFVGMEARRRGGRTAGPAASIARLPEREDEASRAAQHEVRQQRRQQELRYGPRTAEVRALEAALNEAFDRVSHTSSPAMWPSVSLGS